MNYNILVVDDSKTDTLLIRSMLEGYCVHTAENGEEALNILRGGRGIDLMLLDLNMPVMDGFEVLRQVKALPECADLLILILTNSDEPENEVNGLELGASDYIRKPLYLGALRKRVELHLKLKATQLRIEDYSLNLEETIQERTRELEQTRAITIQALVGLLEVRNIESGNHCLRTQWMMKILSGSLRRNTGYAALLTDSYISELFNTAPLHDIGKVGVPDSILLKPGPLTPQEYAIVKKHVQYGVNALGRHNAPDSAIPFIRTALDLIGTHHEWVDGTGYPNGLRGDAIPLCGRMMAIIDTYDAVTSNRPYKAAIPHDQALALLSRNRGTQFDADVLDAFLAVETDIRQITLQYGLRSDLPLFFP